MPNWIEEAEFGGIIYWCQIHGNASISGSDPVKLVEEMDENFFAADASLSLEDFNMGDNNGNNPGGHL